MNTIVSTLLAQESSSNGLGALIFPIVLVGVFALMILPQRKQKKEQQALLASLAVGDEVVTTSGIFGTITYLEDDEPIVHLSIDTDTIIRVTRPAIARKVTEDSEDSEES